MEAKHPTHFNDANLLAQQILDTLKVNAVVPTPAAFEHLYHQLTGSADKLMSETVLPKIARRLAQSNTDEGLLLASYIENQQWQPFSDKLINLVSDDAKENERVLKKVDDEDLRVLLIWRDLTERTLKYTLPDLLKSNTDLTTSAQKLSENVHLAITLPLVEALAKEIKSLNFKIHQHEDAYETKQQSFKKLLVLMIESIKDSINPHHPVLLEVEAFQQLLHEPLDENRLSQAILRTKEIIFKNRA